MAKKKCCLEPWRTSNCECTLQDIIDKYGSLSANSYEITIDSNGDATLTPSSTSTPPTAQLLNNGNGSFTFNNGVTAPVTFDSKRTIVVNNNDGTFTLTDDFGNTVTIDTNETVTTLVSNPNKTFVYTNEVGTLTTVDYKISTITNNGDKTFSYLDDFGATGVIDTNDITTTYVNDVVSGNKIGTYTDELGNPTDVTETITIMNQQANGDIEYLSEDAAVDTAVILSTDANQLLKSGTDKGNLLVATDLISSDANNTILVGSDGKLKVNTVITFPDDQVFNGIDTDTVNITLTPLPPNAQGQVDYNLQADVKTSCEIASDAFGLKLNDSFYENVGTSHITTFPTLTAFDPTKEVQQANVVKDGCSLKVFVNKEEVVLAKFHGLSTATLNSLTDITVAGKSPDIISIIVTSLAADFDFSNWYINTLTTGKKVGQKFIVALDINTPLLKMAYDHANAGLVKFIFDTEILTVKALEANTLYED